MITLVVNSTLGREHIDLDALETAISASARAIGCRALQTALDAYVTYMPPEPILYHAGHPGAHDRHTRQDDAHHTRHDSSPAPVLPRSDVLQRSRTLGSSPRYQGDRV